MSDLKRGTPQGGVASPLLSVLYWTGSWSIGAWRNAARHFFARTSSPMPDFVILSRGHAEEALARTTWVNRLEHRPRRHASKYHKIDCDDAQVDALLVDLFLEAHQRAPREIDGRGIIGDVIDEESRLLRTKQRDPSVGRARAFRDRNEFVAIDIVIRGLKL